MQFCCLCINVGRRYADGKTAYELRCGRSWKRALCNFAERVMWLPSGKRDGTDVADYCMEGIFLGVLIGPKSLTDDFIIGTPTGVYLARAVRRYPECNQWRIADVLAVRGTPWCREPIVGSGKEPLFHGQLPARVALPPVIPRGAQRADENPLGVKQRRFRMEPKNIERFGMTQGCNGCLALLTGAPSANHSEICRARIEGELAKCGGADQEAFEASEAKRQKRQEVRFEPGVGRADSTAQNRDVDKKDDPPAKAQKTGTADPPPVDDDDMTLADYGKRVREREQEGRTTRQRGGSSSSSGPAVPQGQKRKDDSDEQLNPLRPDLAQAVYEDIGRVVIECGKLGSFVNGVDVA